MPNDVDEKKWDKAKASFKKQFKKEPKSSSDFAQVSAIYKKMGGKFGKEMTDLVEQLTGLIQKESFSEASLSVVKNFSEEDADPKELAMGVKVEMEHTDDPKFSKKIALDHLAEIPDYYTRLAKMEAEAKKDKKESISSRIDNLIKVNKNE